jgi:hypothetical protein
MFVRHFRLPSSPTATTWFDAARTSNVVVSFPSVPYNIGARRRLDSEGESTNTFAVQRIPSLPPLVRGLPCAAPFRFVRLYDNQVGESNFYTNNGVGAPVNNFNYDAAAPACSSALSRVDKYSQKCFDPMVDYTYSVLDVPHRVILAPIVRIPSPASTDGWANWLGAGWTAAAIFNIQSGYPIGVLQSNSTSNLLGNGQRPNLVPGVDLATSGDQAARLASADHPSAAWLNAAAFSTAPANTFGNAPRVITDVRTPIQTETDMSVAKNINLAGSTQIQLKVEVINLFNQVQVRGNQMNTTQGNSAFGTIVSQGGFMRTTQIMFRYSF